MMYKVKEILKKYFTQKVRNIISIFIIIFGLIYIIDYSFYKPTYINKFIATNVYKDSANGSFTDTNFYTCVVDAYNNKNDASASYTTNLSDSQLADIQQVSCEFIENTDGLELLTGLNHLSIYDSELNWLSFSSNASLKYLYLSNVKLTNFSLSNAINLEELHIYYSTIPHLNTEYNTKLKNLDVYDTKLDANFSVVHNGELENLSLQNTGLTYINLLSNPNLKSLNLSYNDFSQAGFDLKFSRFTPLLESLVAVGCGLNRLDVEGLEKLSYLNANINSLDDIDLTNTPNLVWLYLDSNKFEDIDVSLIPELAHFNISNNNLQNLNVTNNEKLVSLNANDNELTNLVLSENTDLEILNASNNKLTSMDLSNNLKLEFLNLGNNNFNNVLTRYVGDGGKVNSAVILPTHLTDNIVWNSDDESIAISDIEGNVVTKKVGEVDIVGTSDYYVTRTHVNSFKATSTSDKYTISLDGESIFTGADNNLDNIMDAIQVPEYIEKDINDDFNSIILKKNDTPLKTMKIIYIRVTDNDIKFGDDYIYMRTYSDPRNKFECVDCTAQLSGNYLRISYVSNAESYMHVFKIIYLATSYTMYSADDGYVFVGAETNAQVLNNFRAINGNVAINDGNLEVTYNGETLDSIGIKRMSVDNDYVAGTNYIFTGFDVFDDNKINVSDSSMNVTQTSEGITVSRGTVPLAKYYLLNLETTDLKTDSTKIYVDSGTTYSQFINQITLHGGISAKLYKGSTEVKSGNLEDGMIYKVLYNNEVIKQYVIDTTSYYVDLNNYDVSAKYIILTGDDTINISNINTRNCTLRVEQNTLKVIQNGSVIDSYGIIKITGNYNFLDDYIYVGATRNEDILFNVTVPKGLKKEISDDKLRIMQGNQEIWSITLIRLRSNSYIIDESNKSIFTKSDVLEETISGNIYLTVDYGSVAVIHSGNIPILNISFPDDNTNIVYKLYGYYSENSTYDLNKKIIYIGYSDDGVIDTSDFNSYNVNIIQPDGGNKLKINYKYSDANDESLFEYDILYYKYSDDLLKNVGDYLYTSDFTEYEIIDKLWFSNENMNASVDGDKLTIKYGSDKIDEIPLIRVSSGYNCINGVIFTFGNTFLIDKVTVLNGQKDWGNEDNEIVIKTSDRATTLETYKIVESITFGDLNVFRDKIILSESMLQSVFFDEINAYDGFTTKIFLDDNEVTSGNVSSGMDLIIYFDGSEVTRFHMVSEFVNFARSITFNENDSVEYKTIKGISSNTLIQSVYNMISTSGNIKVYDANGNIIVGTNSLVGTGYEFDIQLSNSIYKYKMSVVGDVNGDGVLSMEDAKETAKHVINYTSEFTNDYTILAADYNRDGPVRMNDVVKMVKAIKENENNS